MKIHTKVSFKGNFFLIHFFSSLRRCEPLNALDLLDARWCFPAWCSLGTCDNEDLKYGQFGQRIEFHLPYIFQTQCFAMYPGLAQSQRYLGTGFTDMPHHAQFRKLNF